MKKKNFSHKNTSNNQKKTAGEPGAATKILFYIAMSDMSDKVKKSWATLIPHMTKEQQRRLLNILEAAFLNKATGSIDEHLSNELTRIEKKYVKQRT